MGQAFPEDRRAWSSGSCGSTTPDAPGGGLGLAMVAAVARLHGGELILRGRDDGEKAGLVATLRIPRWDAEAGPHQLRHHDLGPQVWGALTRPVRSSLPQPMPSPASADPTARITTPYMSWR
jgi:hypothetical protein